MAKFIGRQRELDGLKQLMLKKIASLVVIRGRRRIGKSRLAEEFSKSFKTSYFFTGLAPESGITATDQRIEFKRQLYEQNIPFMPSEDWADLFSALAKHVQEQQALIVLDEITWMGELDKTFLAKLKIIWDSQFKKNNRVILILSGSNSAWIEKNILSSTGFFGRLSYRIHLDELSLSQCNEFWGTQKDNISSFEKFKILSITGGVPRYLEEIYPGLSAEENIKALCYTKEGLLFNEFDAIFHDLFKNKQDKYKQIINVIAQGNITLDQIFLSLKRKKGGDISAALDEMVNDGFISRDYSWNFKTGKEVKASCYRISDNYTRFYLRYILPYKYRIKIGEMNSLPQAWDSMLGIQFENLVFKNRNAIHRILKIDSNEIIFSNPYFQSETTRRQSCQIDYMVQTKFNTLYVCEIKFSKNLIQKKVIDDINEKIKRLEIPKNFSIRPILIHVNGVSDQIITSEYFADVVNFSQLLSNTYDT